MAHLEPLHRPRRAACALQHGVRPRTCEASDTVPKGARAATITMTMTRVVGTYNDGDADDVSLALTKSP
jgi:hypothetical protein